LVSYFSDAPKSASTKGPADFSYAKDRAKYEEKLSLLRKEWQAKHREKLKEKALQEAAERKRIVLRRAIALREKRIRRAQALVEEKLQRERDLLRARERLFRTQLKWEARKATEDARVQQALTDLQKESENYITASNLDEKVTADLFGKFPATTGIVTPHSNHWRYEVFTPKVQRLLSTSFREEFETMSKSRIKAKMVGQSRVTKRMLTEEFLNDMIGTGEDRDKFQELVKAAAAEYDKRGAFIDVDLEYLDEEEIAEQAELNGSIINGSMDDAHDAADDDEEDDDDDDEDPFDASLKEEEDDDDDDDDDFDDDFEVDLVEDKRKR